MLGDIHSLALVLCFKLDALVHSFTLTPLIPSNYSFILPTKGHLFPAKKGGNCTISIPAFTAAYAGCTLIWQVSGFFTKNNYVPGDNRCR
ncbi:hypothetical protein GAB14E_4654 [Colwellia psychrerythraea]|uniref:Uncharacterized protein n=1 Tax=Colwellia psychrerythraea TaxID=28229 RepID=A0A099K9T1_COLPS|nr:hypothetical protein GAB14E_4654 [Colwellia psychrerythraea]